MIQQPCCDNPLYGSPTDPFVCVSCGHDTLKAQQGGVTFEENLETVRGGMDSMAWLLNNVNKQGDRWPKLVKAAWEDRELAIAALGAALSEYKSLNAKMDVLATRIEQLHDLRERLVNLPQGDGFPPDGSVWLLDQVLNVLEYKEAEV